MSSRQFTPFGGTGEIVTLDNINEYDDLPPLAEIDSPDVYEIRTGNFATDYLVPMQDGSTDFNEWYSLVDGQVLSAIPDIGLDHFYWSQELETVDPWSDEEGDKDLSASGDPILQDGINNNQTVSYGGGDSHISVSAAALGSNQVYTFAVVFQLDDANTDQSLFLNGDVSGGNGYELAIDDGSYRVFHHGNASETAGTVDTDPHVAVGTYDGNDIILDIDGANIMNRSHVTPDNPDGAIKIAEGSQNNLVGDVGAAGHEGAAADANRRDDLTEMLAEPFDIPIST